MSRYLLPMLALLGFVSSVHAQNTVPHHCSVMTDQVIGGSHQPHNCNSWWPLWSQYTDVFTIDYTCAVAAVPYNGTPRPIPPTGSITTHGECTTKLTSPFSGTVDCTGYYTTKYNEATNQGMNDSFFWYPYDRRVASKIDGSLTCAADPQPTIFAVCYSVWCVTRSSPIIVDLDGGGLDRFTDVEHGVMFKFGDQMQKVSWPKKDAMLGFLCLPDPGGQCDDASDLFGNFTPQPPPPPGESQNGFNALRPCDTAHVGVIDARSACYPFLGVWVDLNHNGKTDAGEFFPLAQLGITISLAHEPSTFIDPYGNAFAYTGTMMRDGIKHEIVDVFLAADCGKK